MGNETTGPVLKTILTTAEAAKALNRKPQTLRSWACLKTGPINPIHIHGRLGWKAEDIAGLLNGDKVS